MTQTLAATLPENFLLHIHKEIEIGAPPAIVFESLLDEIGPANEMPDGRSMSMKIEPWPGGRWFRDLGNNAGHLWGHVQVIKPPMLLELCGPLFMSYPAISHVQYRLTEQGKGTRLTLTHKALGDMAQEHREGVVQGWTHILERIRKSAEKTKDSSNAKKS
jgi:uncharacterized protein YndB with AHSA1/START domain